MVMTRLLLGRLPNTPKAKQLLLLLLSVPYFRVSSSMAAKNLGVAGLKFEGA